MEYTNLEQILGLLHLLCFVWFERATLQQGLDLSLYIYQICYIHIIFIDKFLFLVHGQKYFFYSSRMHSFIWAFDACFYFY